MDEKELKSIQDLAIATFAREIRASRSFVDLARVLGVPKLRALRTRAAEIETAREAQVSCSANKQPQFELRAPQSVCAWPACDCPGKCALETWK